MKKVIFVLLLLAAGFAGFSQTKKPIKFGWKIGLLTSLPADNDAPATRVTLGSTFGEVSTSVSKKITIIGNLAYIKYKDNEGKSFSQIPVLLGAKYSINDQFYFGVDGGLAFYNKNNSGVNFVYTPRIGMQLNKVSVDARYINTVRDEPIKVLALVFSYKL